MVLRQGARQGSKNDTDKLIEFFMPLLKNACTAIYWRFNKLVPIEELMEVAKNSLLTLILIEYNPSLKVPLLAFIKINIYAKLTLYARPIAEYRKRQIITIKRFVFVDYTLPSDRIQKTERNTIIEDVFDKMKKNFSDREKDVIVKHVFKGIPRVRLAKNYGVTTTRVKQIQDRCLVKLRRFLSSKGVKSLSDI